MHTCLPALIYQFLYSLRCKFFRTAISTYNLETGPANKTLLLVGAKNFQVPRARCLQAGLRFLSHPGCLVNSFLGLSLIVIFISRVFLCEYTGYCL
ncbi:hypothetical protein MTMBA_16720 [Moorella thermoacetica]|nr:hypothetical protein MTIN_14950 [Moorella thermoacetica]